MVLTCSVCAPNMSDSSNHVSYVIRCTVFTIKQVKNHSQDVFVVYVRLVLCGFVCSGEVSTSSVGSVVLMMLSLRSQVFSGVVSVDWLTAGRFISQRAAELCCCADFPLILIVSFTGVESSVWIRCSVSRVEGCSHVYYVCKPIEKLLKCIVLILMMHNIMCYFD